MTVLSLGLCLLAVAPASHPAQQLIQLAPQTQRVYAGMYLADVSGFDLREGRFQADLDVWLKWSGAADPPILRFVNGEIDHQEEQERESDGAWHSIRWRIQGTFRGTFPLQAFPFDRQELKIELSLPGDKAHLVPDLGSSGMSTQFSITGWEYEPFFRAEVGKEVLASDLGAIRSEGQARVLEAVTFIVDLKRPATSNILKFMLPLAVILIMAFLVFALPPGELEVRSAMGVTALLSVVAFHFAMSDALPDVPYLVAADRLFLTSYVLVLLSVLESVVRYRMGEKRERAGRFLDRASAVLLSLVALTVAISVMRVPAKLDRLEEKEERLSEPKPAAPKPTAREELRVAVSSLGTLTGNGIGALLRRGLTSVDQDGVLRPHLAHAIPAMTDESVRLLPDGGMLVRWELRHDLKWSDGEPLDADDLVYSLGLIADPDRLAVTKVDERTIEIRYARRLADALTDFPLYPEHVARKLSTDGGVDALRARNQTAPLPGDGPYRVASFTPNQEAVFERNPYFAGTPPALARIRMTVMTPDQMAAALREGQVDLVPVLPNTVVAAVKAVPSAVVDTATDEALLLLQPDLSVPALAEVKMRRALLTAIDRAAVAKAYAPEGGRVAHTYRPDDAADYAEDALPTPYSPDEAKKLFAELGGAPTLKWITADTPGGYVRAAELIATQLTAAGVKLEPSPIQSGLAFQTYQRGNHGGLFLHARRDKKPARFFNLPTTAAVLDTRTPRPWFPAMALQLNAQFETSLFPERRDLLNQRLQRIFAETLPVLPLAFGTQISARSVALDGVSVGQSGQLFWNVETWSLAQ